MTAAGAPSLAPTKPSAPSPHAAQELARSLAIARGDDNKRPRTPGEGFRVMDLDKKKGGKPGKVTLIQYPAPKISCSKPVLAAELRKAPPPFAAGTKSEVDASGERLPSPQPQRNRKNEAREPYRPRGAQEALKPLPGIADWVDGLASTLGETGSGLAAAEKATIVADNRVWADALVRRSTAAAGYLVLTRESFMNDI